VVTFTVNVAGLVSASGSAGLILICPVPPVANAGIAEATISSTSEIKIAFFIFSVSPEIKPDTASYKPL